MSFGAIGFQDGQRTNTLDANTPAFQRSGVFNAQQKSPVIPTAGYEHTLLSALLAGGTIGVTWAGFIDQAGATVLASQELVLDSSLVALWCVTVPNLGPYVQVQIDDLTGGGFNLNSFFALLTNKARPLATLPATPAWTITPQNIPALGTLNSSAPFYWAGPVTFWLNSGATQLEFALQYLDRTNTWNTFWQQNPAASTLLAPASVTWPLAPVRLHQINLSSTTANSSWAFTAVPDLKGI